MEQRNYADTLAPGYLYNSKFQSIIGRKFHYAKRELSKYSSLLIFNHFSYSIYSLMNPQVRILTNNNY